MMVARIVRRNSNTTSTTSAMLSISVNCTSWIEARMVVGAVVDDGELVRRRGIGAAQAGQFAARKRSTVSITLAPG